MAQVMVSASTGAMRSVLAKFSALLENESKPLKAVRGEIMFLKAELESIHAFMQKLSEAEEPHDAQVKVWMKEVRELSYDMEDWIDDFMLRFTSKRDALNLLTAITTRRQLAVEIKSFKARIVEVSERHARYNLDESVPSSGGVVAIEPGMRFLHAAAGDLVGIEGPREELLKWLTEEGGDPMQQRRLKVASIVGMGGVGKTILANEVYRQLATCFGCSAFVSVSQKPDLKKIFRKILDQVSSHEYGTTEAWDEYQLIKTLKEFIKDKKYFIVIDDMWSKSIWENIIYALPDNNRDSRILTTTRIHDVAKLCCSRNDGNIYELEPLNDMDSRSLFVEKFFGSESNSASEWEKEINQILIKCAGLPLAIVSIASLLARKSHPKEWWKNASELMGSKGLEEVNQILALSYNDLPQHLRTCLLYLSIFPEDYTIRKDRLVWRWIAEGFVGVAQGQSLEEVGNNYFDELINRNMIRPVTIAEDGRTMECRVHNMMLNFIISKSTEENFANLCSSQKSTVVSKGRVRRLSIHCSEQDSVLIPTTMNLSCVRSLTIFGRAEGMPPLSDLRVLRVLDLEDCENLENHNLKNIGKFLHLKYLGLRGTRISELPRDIGKLQYLETLDLRETRVRELPVSIHGLQLLVHLLLDSQDTVSSSSSTGLNQEMVSSFSSTWVKQEMASSSSSTGVKQAMAIGSSPVVKQDMLSSSSTVVRQEKLSSSTGGKQDMESSISTGGKQDMGSSISTGGKQDMVSSSTGVKHYTESDISTGGKQGMGSRISTGDKQDMVNSSTGIKHYTESNISTGGKQDMGSSISTGDKQDMVSSSTGDKQDMVSSSTGVKHYTESSVSTSSKQGMVSSSTRVKRDMESSISSGGKQDMESGIFTGGNQDMVSSSTRVKEGMESSISTGGKQDMESGIFTGDNQDMVSSSIGVKQDMESNISARGKQDMLSSSTGVKQDMGSGISTEGNTGVKQRMVSNSSTWVKQDMVNSSTEVKQEMVSCTTGVMNSLLGKLTALMADEYKLLKEVKGDFRFLKGKLESMKVFLEAASELDDPDVQVKCWMKNVRELSYDMEDCIDDFMLLPDREFSMALIDRGLIQELKALAKDKGDEVFSKPSNLVHTDPLLSPLSVKAPRLVGIERPREELIRWLTEGQGSPLQPLKVVSIVGCGGVGKTTLAEEVYCKIRGQFECSAFVSVSHKPNRKHILSDILSQIVGLANTGAWNQMQLIDMLRKYLKEQRYLIIIDDIWSKSAWENITSALPANNHGSRIMITTRIWDVAKSFCFVYDGYVYELKPLNYMDSKNLLFESIFGGSKSSLPSQLREEFEEILKNCAGLPLAIVSIASILVSEPQTRKNWENVRKYYRGSTLGKHPNVERMEEILSLSYNNLPHHLKTCFLYLSVFPEDYIIRRDRLVWRWIAEGFVREECGRSLEEIGESYFDELVNRSIIQPVTIAYDGRIIDCQVHNMILNLIISKSDEENFVNLCCAQDTSVVPEGKVRRLSVHYSDQECAILPTTNIDRAILPTTKIDPSHVRSFTIFGHPGQMPPFLDFRVLRVLDLEDSEKLENHHLENIGRLFQLKYLGLRNTNVSNVPKRIMELQYLETLDLRWTRVKELPASITELPQLAHLLVEYVKLPDGIGNMQALQELSMIEISSSCPVNSVEGLGNLKRLRTLGISWSFSDTDGDNETYKEQLVFSLSKLCKCNLQSLYFDSDSCSLNFQPDYGSSSEYLLQKVELHSYCYPRIPEWMASFPSLTYLNIKVKQVGEKDLQILGELSALLLLKVYSTIGPKERLTIGSKGFQSLKEFEFICWHGMGLVFEAGAMPKLESLDLLFNAHETTRYSGFDFGMQHLSCCLKQVHVDIDCEGSKAWEVEAAEAAIRDRISIHPNNPALHMLRLAESKMIEEDTDSSELEDSEEECNGV